jgi:hypothetical protein
MFIARCSLTYARFAAHTGPCIIKRCSMGSTTGKLMPVQMQHGADLWK